ncbi:MAG: hypothetical protein HDS77_02145 [Bacteroidales bacterium]|nr:hypothetical protein [Bacteroidales bacterium]
MKSIRNNTVFMTALVALMAICSMTAKAQDNVVSPYSRFGYGMLNDHATSAQRAMGGVGYGMNNGRQINSMNPASYAAIDTLTFLFDMGVDLKSVNLKQGSESGNKLTGGLDYLNIQFPLGKYMGGSVGFLPYSESGYAFGEEIVNGEEAHQGSGTINELYVGVSGRLFKGFTIGANISYLFGNLINDTYLTTSNSSTTLFEKVLQIRDYYLRFGAQYSWNIGARNRATIGVVYSPGKDFRGKTYGVYYDVSNTSSKPDTIGYQHLNGNYSRPATYGVGLNYQWNNKLMAEVDFTYQPWRDAKVGTIEGFEATKFDNRWKVNLGLQYMPDARGSYLQRVRYRVGALYNHDYIMVGDNNVKDIGVSFGFGLPTPINRFTKTVVNLGFEYRHRQSSPMKLVTENYFQVTLGINFNELWFWQNKIM